MMVATVKITRNLRDMKAVLICDSFVALVPAKAVIKLLSKHSRKTNTERDKISSPLAP